MLFQLFFPLLPKRSSRDTSFCVSDCEPDVEEWLWASLSSSLAELLSSELSESDPDELLDELALAAGALSALPAEGFGEHARAGSPSDRGILPSAAGTALMRRGDERLEIERASVPAAAAGAGRRGKE